MRIGLVTGEYPPMQGGVGDFTRELARALVELGHTVVVITSAALAGRVADPRIQVEAVIPKWTRTCWRLIAETARRCQLDVLNVQYEPAAYAMQVGINFFPWWFRRQSQAVPVVTTFHDLLVPYLFPKAGPLRWKSVEFLARCSQAVIATNEDDWRKIKKSINPTNRLILSPTFHQIPIGSNIPAGPVSHAERRHERVRWGAGEGDWLLAYFGFLNASKGGLTLMRAVGLLANAGLPVRLVLIGGRTGSSDSTNAQYAAEVDRTLSSMGLRDRVRHTGYVETEQVAAALAASDVITLPYVDGASLRRGSLLAALAHGKAIITTRPRVAVPGLVDSQNCILIPPEDPGALADGVRRVMTDPGLRSRLETGAHDLAQRFSWDKIAARVAAVYRGVSR